MNEATLSDLLRRVVPRCLAGATDVDGLRRIGAGASQSIHAFDAVAGASRAPLILRCERVWNAQSQAGSAGMQAEAALLRAAAAGGVPVPGVRTVLVPDDGLGNGYVMDRVDGETRGRKLAHAAVFEAARARLAHDCGSTLARIHALPAAALPWLRHGAAAEELAAWHERQRRSCTARPVFAWAARWLADNVPLAPRVPVLVHGDFRNGNLVVGPEGLRAVLDWELAHRGDPMEDLGWFCVNSWRFGRIDKPAGGFGSREALFEGYEAAGGVSVEAARVHWWEVFGTFKWGIVCDGMGEAFSRGDDPSILRAAVGRRASEAEIDLLQLLAPAG